MITSLAALTEVLAKKAVPFQTLTHASCDSAKTWAEAILLQTSSASSATTTTIPTKTLAIKPKGGSIATALVMAVTAGDAEFGVSQLIKHLGAKEGRVAADDLVLGTLKVPKIDGTFKSSMKSGESW